ncbi:MAG: hypothetical protein IT167_23695 [Bryobacterales bacterium]|nr:hypothetical protein [Bryobacterales bacterium]
MGQHPRRAGVAPQPPILFDVLLSLWCGGKPCGGKPALGLRHSSDDLVSDWFAEDLISDLLILFSSGVSFRFRLSFAPSSMNALLSRESHHFFKTFSAILVGHKKSVERDFLQPRPTHQERLLQVKLSVKSRHRAQTKNAENAS